MGSGALLGGALTRALGWAIVVCIAATALPRPAHAYIDAGTGGLLVQMLLAGVAGAAVVLRMYWRKLTGLFVRRDK